MKIAIISINIYTSGLNFASVLHSYAFQQFLAAHGIEAVILDYMPLYFDNFDLKHPGETYRQRNSRLAEQLPYVTDTKERADIQAQMETNTKKAAEWDAIFHEREIRWQKFHDFIEHRYIKTDFCYNTDLLELMDPGFDCYICATDVIWKNEPETGLDRAFFLASTAMENKWKIAYAAGRGREVKTEAKKKLFFHYLQDIDYISVRENSLKEYIEQNSDLKAQHVLDPVLLNDAAFYEALAITPQEQQYILLYYVMANADDTIRQAVNYARQHHLVIIEITDQPLKDGKAKCKDVTSILKYGIGIEEWLGYIKHAECIFTNSFHCACLSILFEKDFYTGQRKSDKVSCLMHHFDLQHRMIDMDTNLSKVADIDWINVRKALNFSRDKSAQFILSALHDIEGKQRAPHDYEAFKKKQRYRIAYYATEIKQDIVSSNYSADQGDVKRQNHNTIAFYPAKKKQNHGKSKLQKNQFYMKHYSFAGWHLRLKIDRLWFWILEDGSLRPVEQYTMNQDQKIKRFKEGDAIPYIPVNRIREMAAEVIWERKPSLLAKIIRKMRK